MPGDRSCRRERALHRWLTSPAPATQGAVAGPERAAFQWPDPRFLVMVTKRCVLPERC